MFKHTPNGEELPVAQSPRQVAPPSISRVRLSILPPSSFSPKLQYPMEFSPLNLVNSEQTSWFPYLLLYIYIYIYIYISKYIYKSKTFRTFLKQCYTKKIMSLTFWGPYIVKYSYNRSQQDATFLNFILIYNSTCFGQTYCPSSGVLILYSQQLVFVILFMLTAC